MLHCFYIKNNISIYNEKKKQEISNNDTGILFLKGILRVIQKVQKGVKNIKIKKPKIRAGFKKVKNINLKKRH